MTLTLPADLPLWEVGVVGSVIAKSHPAMTLTLLADLPLWEVGVVGSVIAKSHLAMTLTLLADLPLWEVGVVGSVITRHRLAMTLTLLADRGLPGFTGTDPDGLLDGQDEDLAVADLSGTGTGYHGIDCFLYIGFGDGNLHSNLLEQIHFDFNTPVGFGIAFLLTASHGIGDRNLEDLLLVQFLFYAVQHFGLNICNNKFHFCFFLP